MRFSQSWFCREHVFLMEYAWTHKICMDARNLHGRTEFAWTHAITMDSHNLHQGTEFAWWCGGDSRWKVCDYWGLSRLVGRPGWSTETSVFY